VRGWLARIGAASLEMTAPPGVVNINTLDDLQALERRAAASTA
jgi:GTP:adenosylcobinamide-phosphate guanylyltransferase